MVVISIVLTEENASQMEALFGTLSRFEVRQYSVFLPHTKGRGAAISELRLTGKTYLQLPQIVRDNFMRIPHRTERERLAMGIFPEAGKRSLTLALTPKNIDRLEAMDPADIIAELEAMDDAYYESIPSMAELANIVGKLDNDQLFRLRDLYLHWQKRYIMEHPIDVPDMNEETHSFSSRIYPEK